MKYKLMLVMKTVSKDYEKLILEIKNDGCEIESDSALKAWIKLCNIPSSCDDYVMIGYAIDENNVLYEVHNSEHGLYGAVTQTEKILSKEDFENKIKKENAMQAKFTYFKDTGKYYTEGRGIVPEDFGSKCYSKIELVNFNDGNAPGLNGHGNDFIWLVEGYAFVPKLIIS